MDNLELYDDILRYIKHYQYNVQKHQYIPVNWKLNYAETLFGSVYHCLNMLEYNEFEKVFIDIKSSMKVDKTTVQDLHNIVFDKLCYSLSEFEVFCDENKIQYDYAFDLAINAAQMLLSLNQNKVDPFRNYIDYFKHINSSKDLICKTNDISVIMVTADMCNSILSNCDKLINSLHKIVEGRIAILENEEGVEH